MRSDNASATVGDVRTLPITFMSSWCIGFQCLTVTVLLDEYDLVQVYGNWRATTAVESIECRVYASEAAPLWSIESYSVVYASDDTAVKSIECIVYASDDAAVESIECIVYASEATPQRSR